MPVVATVLPSAVTSIANRGPHGFSEILYLFSSSTGNNGSAFAGITGNTMFYNITGAVAMFVGRFFMIIPAMAIAGTLAAKKTVPASAGTFPTDGGLFVGLVVGVILIVGGLTFFRELAPAIIRIGDFSLNVANELTADLYVREGLERVVPSFDLNWEQFTALAKRVDPVRLEAVIHQHLPMFHNEHCVFAATLSSGKDWRDCGRPCDRHRVELRDRQSGSAFRTLKRKMRPQ